MTATQLCDRPVSEVNCPSDWIHLSHRLRSLPAFHLLIVDYSGESANYFIFFKAIFSLKVWGSTPRESTLSPHLPPSRPNTLLFSTSPIYHTTSLSSPGRLLDPLDLHTFDRHSAHCVHHAALTSKNTFMFSSFIKSLLAADKY